MVITTDIKSPTRLEIFERLLDLLPAGRLIDLGAGHGTFSMLAADRGWQVTAIDARTERWPDDARISWVHRDVRDADLSGQDLILCLGLFYHLTLADQLQLLAKCSGTPLIIDTHLTCEGNARSSHRRLLSDEVEAQGYSGRFYDEELSSPLASWINEKSFWPSVDSFYRMLAQNGYTVVMAADPWYEPDRTFFLCLPPKAPTAAATPRPWRLQRLRRTGPVRVIARVTRPLRQRVRAARKKR